MYWGSGWGMGWMMGWWWIVWILVIAGVVWVLAKSVGGRTGGHEETPELILKRRYARGDISRDEYEQRLADLRK